MRVKVRLIRENRVVDIDLPNGSRVSDLLKKLNLRSVSHIVIKNGEPIPESYQLADGDEVEVLPVVSGGL